MSYEGVRDCGRDSKHTSVDLVTKTGMFLEPVYILMWRTQGKRFKRFLKSHDEPQTTTTVTNYDWHQIPILAHRCIIILTSPPTAPHRAVRLLLITSSSRLPHHNRYLLCLWFVTTNFKWTERKGGVDETLNDTSPALCAHDTIPVDCGFHHPIIHRNKVPSAGRRLANRYL